MADVCIHCGQTEDQHHAFEAKQMPTGCVCDPGTWGETVAEVCDAYQGDGRTYCGQCEHDRACHQEATDDR